ncbi:MAG TPA: response regulator transcription factor [Verrucomicrobiae bacterium]|jgi:DNA-binding NarL/FixJ family response regulator
MPNLEKKDRLAKSRVFIVEDHPIFRDGLIQILKTESDLQICGKAEDYESGLKGIKQHKPDLSLIDLELPGKSGLELIKKIRALKLPVKLLVVSMYDEALYADRVLRAGGDGYIMKEESPDEIINAIRDVLGGHIYVSEEVSSGKMAGSKPPSRLEKRPLDELSDLELNVLELLGQGKDNAEIAAQLGLKAVMAAAHCAQIRKKLKLKTDNALVYYAVRWMESGAA